MNDVIVSQVINQLSHFIMHRNALGLDADEFETLREDMSTIQGLLAGTGTNVGIRKERAAVLTKRLDRVAYEIADMLEELSMMSVEQPKSVDQRSLLNKVNWSREFGFKISVYSSTLKKLLNETRDFKSNLRLHLNQPELRPQAENDQSCGRENDKISLLEHLLADTSKQVEVISIVGFLGSGKTTLARSLFSDDHVKKHFHIQDWMHVSNVFDELSIASRLLDSLGTHNTGKLDSESRFQLLEEHFSGKVVLLVFDDVWTEDVSKWEPFKSSLRNSAPGSKILVTTRSERVANAACSDFVHSLGPLSNSDCWLISKGVALKGKHEIPKEMIKIGKKIAKNCKGSPLIAKVVGMKLLHTHTPQEWQRVLDNGIWQMEEVATSLFSQFYLTYDELSPESRLCIWYCAFFPRDHVINVDQLIRLWMAQGYFGYPAAQADNKVIEVKGMECFNELANHCFFQDLAKDSIHKDRITSCRIQGTAHEFIKSMVSRYSADKKSKTFLRASKNRDVSMMLLNTLLSKASLNEEEEHMKNKLVAELFHQ